jgi:hypothetical protein
MVKALIDITNDANRILNIIKAAYGLNDKSQAIDMMAKQYEEIAFEPKIKASYLKKLEKISKEKIVHVGTIDDFDRKYGLGKYKKK